MPRVSAHLRTSQARAARLSRRGLTLLEILLAVTLLVLLTTSITAAISSIVAMEANSRHRVAGCELANRIILQYLDDEETLPSDALPLDYGKHRYFWKLRDWNVQMSINKTQQGLSSGLQGLNRYKMVRVDVYEAIEEGDYPVPGERIARVERMFDPATARNPDSISKIDADGIRKLINTVTGGAAPSPAGSGGRR